MAAPTGGGLGPYVDGTVTVLTNDGRHLVGTLRGYDQATNLILDECHERVYQDTAGVETIVLGLYVVRGDNIAVIGELDEDLDSQIDLTQIKASPLKPVTH
ncbi:hypothetical protein Ndes2526B_g04830 [Nannochloris sp. 'desiccata']|nr:hypothetical protein KSW81_000468 [Chlorella desiccata (nom. nud.)]KAH7620894.1 putative Sm-like protein LSM8 [Chlorella desiccata (nom. nud.)]